MGGEYPYLIYGWKVNVVDIISYFTRHNETMRNACIKNTEDFLKENKDETEWEEEFKKDNLKTAIKMFYIEPFEGDIYDTFRELELKEVPGYPGLKIAHVTDDYMDSREGAEHMWYLSLLTSPKGFLSPSVNFDDLLYAKENKHIGQKILQEIYEYKKELKLNEWFGDSNKDSNDEEDSFLIEPKIFAVCDVNC